MEEGGLSQMTALLEYLLALKSESLLNLGQVLRAVGHGHILSYFCAKYCAVIDLYKLLILNM